VQNVTDRVRNPFDMQPPCEPFVPGYGDANADFHVVGDHPGVHGGVEDRVPFTGSLAGDQLRDALAAAGVVDAPDSAENVFYSYVHMCVPDGEPSHESYRGLEPFFDAELRAITAHVLLPVGERATRHVLETCTAIDPEETTLQDLHATELHGSGWLVVPALDPAGWTDDQRDAYVETLQAVVASDYTREADLGRFLAGPEPYTVR
jgi:uracil-DNA glycosylase family 4